MCYNWLIVLASSYLLLPSGLSAQTSCVNSDFEQSPVGLITSSTQVAGWTITRGNATYAIDSADNCNMKACCPFNPVYSQILSTSGGYVDPAIGTIYPLFSVFGPGQTTSGLSYNPQLPAMGGDKILCLNNYTSNPILSERATKTILVTPATNVLKVAYSVVLVPFHRCCESPGFKMALSTSTCMMVNTNSCASNSLAGFYDAQTGIPATLTSTLVFSKWKVRVLDLTPYMGQLVTLSLTASRCIFSAHAGYAYIDAECGSSLLSFNGTPLTNTSSAVTTTACYGTFTLATEPFYESYLWTGPNGFQATSNVITSNQPGTYTVQLGQENCDPIIRMVTITQPPPMVVASSGTACAGENVVLTASGAATYTWVSPVSFSPTIQVQPVTSTVYSVNGTMANGCAHYASFTVDPKPLPVLGVVSPTLLCSKTSQTLKASGANTYEWFSSSGFYSNTPSALFSTNMSSGAVNFTLTGTSADGCKTSTLFTMGILPLPDPALTLLPSDSVCAGTEVTLQASGASFYSWFGPGAFQSTGQTVVFKAYGVHSGTYSVRVTDTQGCTAEAAVMLYVAPVPSATISGKRDGCEPFCTKLTAVSAPGSNIETTWNLNGETSTGSDLKPCFLSAGEHAIDLALKDLKTTCTASLATRVSVYPAPVADFRTVPEVLSEFLEEVELVNTSHGEKIVYLKWYVTPDVKLETGLRNFVRVNEAGVFPVALYIQNEWGCTDTVVKKLVIPEEPLIYIPDAFTPNGDGINDTFRPVTYGQVSYSFTIFDRWGEKIFETDQSGAGWDGKFKGAVCQDGVYVCLMVVKNTKIGEKKLQRAVSLLH